MAKGKVVIAMSGGVDSSVAAALLVEQGYDVIGITMRLWAPDDELEVEGSCCSLSSVEDARRVAEHLGIPFYVLNFKERFKTTVVDYFVSEYRLGRTPNPCIACNRYLKFDLLLSRAKALGAEYVATGHYVRSAYEESIQRYVLYRAKDLTKDQSYALYTLTQEQLAHLLFPLGEYPKEETRKLAERYNLVTADKPESQEICFIPDNDYKTFWRDYTGETPKPGLIKTVEGKVLGTHTGIQNYTIGQRRGIGVAAGYPIYVVDIKPEENTIVVGRNEDVFVKGLAANYLNWISIRKPEGPFKANAKIRYTAEPKPCTIYPKDNGEVEVLFEKKERAITPGQAVVFYDSDMVVGGGTIVSQIR